MPGHRRMNQIVRQEGTRGSETSNNPEEKKENSISLVVASEEERGQTEGLRTLGVEEQRYMTIGELNGLERPAIEGESPVFEREGCETGSRVPLDT